MISWSLHSSLTPQTRGDRLGRQRSAELMATAKQYIPGGVNSPARSWAAVGGDPLFIAKGDGSRLWDADGNEYIDYVCSWGPMILGHAHPDVVAAVQGAAVRGTSFGAPTEAENHSLSALPCAKAWATSSGNSLIASRQSFI